MPKDLPIWGPSPQEAEIARLKADIDRMGAEMLRCKLQPEGCQSLKNRAAAAKAESARYRLLSDTQQEALGQQSRRLVEAEAESARLAALLAEAREALEFYADPDSWQPIQNEDNTADWSTIDETDIDRSCGANVPIGGKRARALLARLTPGDKRPPECEGQGACHGALKWCSACGDVSRTCDPEGD